MLAIAQTTHSTGLKLARMLRDSASAHGIFLFVLAIQYMGYGLLHLLRPDLRSANVLGGSMDLVAGTVQVLLLCLFLTFVGWLGIWFNTAIRHAKPDKPLLALAQSLGQLGASLPQRLVHGIPMMAITAAVLFITSDMQGKTLAINPNTWDAAFAALEAKLHFGMQPWELLQPLLGHPAVTFILSLNYSIWFLAMWSFTVYFAFMTGGSQLRTRYFLTFLGTWVFAGNLLAMIFSTGGPCYYARLGIAPDPFSGLMAYLRHANGIYPVWSLEIQDLLWNGHVNDVPLSMISAMPSLHNAAALLFVLAAYRINRILGHVLALHAALIFLGSIHLGWHYAVDSYLSWAIVLGIWWLSKPIAAWWHGVLASEKLPNEELGSL